MGPIVRELLDDLFLFKATFVFNWTFTSRGDTTAPTISSAAPTGNVNSAQPPISANYQDNTGVDVTRVKLLVDGADVTAAAQVSATSISYATAHPLAQGAHTVQFNVVDTTGNPASATWTFSVDSVAPTVTGQSPKSTQAASPASTISAQFADSGTGVDTGRTVLTVDGQNVTAQASANAAGITFTPSSPLANGSHSVTLRVADHVGNTTDTSWTFGVDATGPDITNAAPKDVTLAADALPA